MRGMLTRHSIGSACARQLAAQGVHLALTYSSSVAAIEALVKELHEVHPDLRLTTHKVDLASIEQTSSLCPDVVKQHGKVIDILVSNAGYGVRIQNVWEIPLEEFEHTINVNLRASFLLVKGVVDGMREQKWGRIIFISSIAAYGAGINGCRKSPVSLITIKIDSIDSYHRLRGFQGWLDGHDEEPVIALGRIQYFCQ